MALSKKNQKKQQEVILPCLKSPCYMKCSSGSMSVGRYGWDRRQRGGRRCQNKPQRKHQQLQLLHLTGLCTMNKQGSNAELLSGSEHAARTTSLACADTLRDFHLTSHTFRLLYWWPQRERAGHRPFPRVSSKHCSKES